MWPLSHGTYSRAALPGSDASGAATHNNHGEVERDDEANQRQRRCLPERSR
jgi:hypothetical protein